MHSFLSYLLIPASSRTWLTNTTSILILYYSFLRNTRIFHSPKFKLQKERHNLGLVDDNHHAFSDEQLSVHLASVLNPTHVWRMKEAKNKSYTFILNQVLPTSPLINLPSPSLSITNFPHFHTLSSTFPFPSSILFEAKTE